MMRSQFAQINKIQLHYVSAGSGELILFLHGFPECWYQWKNQLSELSDRYFVVALDMRGYNLSSKPVDKNLYEMPYLIEDIRQFIIYLGYQKCILVGHDWGGMVSWNFAMKHPDYLNRLIVINAPHPAIFEELWQHNADQLRASRYMWLFCSRQAEIFLSQNDYEKMWTLVFSDVVSRRFFTEVDKKIYMTAWSQENALTGMLNYYRVKHPFLSCVMDVPTLVIWGEQDPMLLIDNLNGLEKWVTNITIERIPDASHWVTHEKPALINQLILR